MTSSFPLGAQPVDNLWTGSPSRWGRFLRVWIFWGKNVDARSFAGRGNLRPPPACSKINGWMELVIRGLTIPFPRPMTPS